MEAIFVLLCIGIPCLIGIIFCLTPRGKQWRKSNGML